MGYRYAVLGAGRRGTAAACDLARFGEACDILLLDRDIARARASARRVSRISRGLKVSVRGALADASQPRLPGLLRGRQGVLSALPSGLNPAAARAAVAAGAHYCDLGGRLEDARAVLKLDAAARRAGVTLVPDCGLAPGLATSLAVRGMESLEFPREVKVLAGSLPGKPGAGAAFDIEGLISRCEEPAVVLRRGKVLRLESLAEAEEVTFAPLGLVEARLTGGSSTCPSSFQSRLQGFEYKTLRYPGHFEAVRALRELGFFAVEPVEVDGGRVAPRRVLAALAARVPVRPAEGDVAALRVLVRGEKSGRPTELAYELVEYPDRATGFSAMDRAAGFAAAAVLWLQVEGKVKGPGAAPLESCLPARAYLQEVRRRGLTVRERIQVLSAGRRR